ncbi:hypothetical protein [Frigoribacterium sp. UYMn621]|uniref:hypothetical protein n=1 Tax=Frigoribacterium sp. UYMn621 TaxID=3156343 RepID=UPI00339AE0DB
MTSVDYSSFPSMNDGGCAYSIGGTDVVISASSRSDSPATVDISKFVAFQDQTPVVTDAPSLGSGAKVGVSPVTCAVDVPATNLETFPSLLLLISDSRLTGKSSLPAGMCDKLVPILRTIATQ